MGAPSNASTTLLAGPGLEIEILFRCLFPQRRTVSQSLCLFATKAKKLLELGDGFKPLGGSDVQLDQQV